MVVAWAAVPLGWRFATAIVVAPILVAPFGLVLERLMRRTYGRDPLYGLLLTFGVAMVLEELIREIWGTRDYMLPVPGNIGGGFIMLDLILVDISPSGRCDGHRRHGRRLVHCRAHAVRCHGQGGRP